MDVRIDEVSLPNGNTSTREWIKHPGAVCIIPRLPDNRIALIRQYRYPVKKEMIELPAGKLEENENPEACAKREMEEEIGYRTEKLTLLTHFHPAVGFADEIMGLYLAESLVKTAPNQDEDEFLCPNSTDFICKILDFLFIEALKYSNLYLIYTVL